MIIYLDLARFRFLLLFYKLWGRILHMCLVISDLILSIAHSREDGRLRADDRFMDFKLCASGSDGEVRVLPSLEKASIAAQHYIHARLSRQARSTASGHLLNSVSVSTLGRAVTSEMG